VLPDYITFSAPIPVAERLLESLPSPWTTKRSVSAFYEETRRCGGVTVSMPADPNAAARVEVSGNGCRELEAAQAVTNWQAFLARLLREKAKFTRLDAALDDHTELLCIDIIITACEERRVVSRFREINFHPKMDASTGETTGRGVSFGTRGSRTYIRIYDKALQQRVPGPWVRVEIETRKEQAHRLAEVIVKHGAQAVPPLLLNYLDFKERGPAKRRNRLKTASWWTAFLGTTERRRLETAPRNVSLESTHNWLIQGVSSSFARVHDSDMGDRLVVEMLAHGRQKLKGKSIGAIKSQAEPVTKPPQKRSARDAN